MKAIAKGQKLALSNEIPSKLLFINTSWDQSQASNYDIDLSILMLGSSNKLEKEDNFIFYNNTDSQGGAVKILSSAWGNYKKATQVDLQKIPADVSRLVFVLTIDNGDSMNQRFGSVKDIHVDFCDNNKTPLLQYKVEGLSQETAIITVEVYKHNNEWKVQATGNGFNAGLDAILKQYGDDSIQVAEPTASSPPPVTSQPSFTPPPVTTSTASASNVSSNAKFQVVLALDISYSMTIMLRNGTAQEFIEKILDFSSKNGCNEIDVFPFHDEPFNLANKLTSSTKDKFISREIISKYSLGGCNYSPIMKMISDKYPSAGKGRPPLLVVFLTDGDCEDKPKTQSTIKEISSKGIFWQFVGVGDKKDSFSFLNELDTMSGRTIDNANFFFIENLKKINNQELQSKILNEYPKWYQEAKNKNICS